MTVSQDNFQQLQERDVLTVTHTVRVEEENYFSTLQTAWCEPRLGKFEVHPNRQKALNLLTAMMRKIKICLSDVSDRNGAAKKTKQNTIHTFSTTFRSDIWLIISVCVYFCRNNFQINALIIKKTFEW